MRYVDDSKDVGTKSGRVVTWMRIICDTLADLPAPDTYDGITICMGSRAFVIADGSKHVLQSGGQWVQQGSSAATYTRGEIDTMVQQINAENSAQQAEINYLANTGAKNLLMLNQVSGTTAGVDWSVYQGTGIVTASRNSGTSDSTKLIAEFELKAGTYIFTSYPNASFSTADSFITSGGTTVARDVDGSQNFTLTQDAAVRISCRIRSNISAAEFKPMIRPAEITDSTFQPYAPTNRQLYELIKQYHP